MTRSEVLATLRILRSFGPLPRKRRIPRHVSPSSIEREYEAEIIAFLDNARVLVERDVMPAVIRLSRRFDSQRYDADDINAILDELSERFFKAVPRGSLESLAEKTGKKTSDFQREQFRKQAKAALGIDIFRDGNIAPKLGAFITENVALIKSVPNKYIDDVEKTIARGLRDGLRHEAIAKLIEERHKVAKSSAKLIARDQVGKFYGEVAGERQKAMGIERYIWRTVHDNRVRDEHAELDGQTFAWSDPPSEGHPGFAINCRCFAEPIFEDFK